MNVKCISCTCVFALPDNHFKTGIPKTRCPFCKVYFKPVIKKAIATIPKGTVQTVDLGASNFEKDTIGWLVVHDEKVSSQTFNLRLGRQVVGRKSETKPCDIMIDCKDPFMGRNHFEVNVVARQGNIIVYELSDFGSKNHTFINTKELAKSDIYYLQDNDTIQAGETKIVFRNTDKVKSDKEARQNVISSKYQKTVLVKQGKNQS